MKEESYDYFGEEDQKRLSEMLMLSRAESGMSQEKVAFELGIAKKTVQNWERGVSSPTLPQAIEWFRAMNVAAMPYLIQFIFPDTKNISAKDDDEKIRKSLISIIDTLPPEGIRQLLYLFYGDHGSSPRATVNLMTAHLQTPLRDRYNHAAMIMNDYKISEDKAQTSRPDHIQPDMALLEKSLKAAREAVVNNRDSYIILK